MTACQTPIEMPRKNAGYRLDERCINALRELAKRTGKSVNEYLEDLLFQHGKINGVIAPDEEPLGETRGGKRPRKGEADREFSAAAQQEEEKNDQPKL
jgi:hypothetical protein